MLLKLIRCDVATERREAFSRGQETWGELAQLPGFLAQGGGWSESQAVLVGWWADWPAYAAFRAEHHDALLARSGQGLACDRIETSYWESVAQESVDRRDNPDAAGAPDFMQVEEFELGPGCLPEFREFLTWRWRPALASAPGLHEARLCRHRKRPGRYLIWSTWGGAARPVSLASLLQPGYRVPQRRLQLLRSHHAERIPLESNWQLGQELVRKSNFTTPVEPS